MIRIRVFIALLLATLSIANEATKVFHVRVIDMDDCGKYCPYTVVSLDSSDTLKLFAYSEVETLQMMNGKKYEIECVLYNTKKPEYGYRIVRRKEISK